MRSIIYHIPSYIYDNSIDNIFLKRPNQQILTSTQIYFYQSIRFLFVSGHFNSYLRQFALQNIIINVGSAVLSVSKLRLSFYWTFPQNNDLSVYFLIPLTSPSSPKTRVHHFSGLLLILLIHFISVKIAFFPFLLHQNKYFDNDLL